MLHARMLKCSFVLAAGVLASAFAMQTDEKNPTLALLVQQHK